MSNMVNVVEFEERLRNAMNMLETGEKLSAGDVLTLYTAVNQICSTRRSKSEQMYKCQENAIKSYIKHVALPKIKAKQDEDMVRELVACWRKYKAQVELLSRVFYYLERDHIPQFQLPTVNEVGLMCFKDVVFNAIKVDIKINVLKLIEKERQDDVQVDKVLLRHLIEIFAEMDIGNTGSTSIYDSVLEAPILCETIKYYSRKAASWIVHHSCPAYISKVEECMEREKERAGQYLKEITTTKISQSVREGLLLKYHQQLLEKEDSGLRELVKSRKMDDLKRLEGILSPIPGGLKCISKIFGMHVKDEALTVVKAAEENVENRKEFIEKLIELSEKYRLFVGQCFMHQSEILTTLHTTVSSVLEKRIGESPGTELLAIFCHKLLSSSNLADEVMEDTLEKVVKLAKYIESRDMFVEFYRKKLAHRLLVNATSNDHHYEQTMLTMLTKAFGQTLTKTIRGMMTDIMLSKEKQAEWKNYLDQIQPQCRPRIDLHVTTLATNNWPSFPSFEMILPEEMVKCMESYNQWFCRSRKKLKWDYAAGSCNVAGRFEANDIQLVVSPFQAACLLLFNDADSLSYTEIKEKMNLPHDEVRRVLHSLSCAKYKILSKCPTSNELGPEDIFTYNAKFTHRRKSIKIPFPQVYESKKVVEEVEMVHRSSNIDACIIRIMKTAKTLGYQQLVSECTSQLAQIFKPNIKYIKARIDHLIDKEYLERAGHDRTILHYLP